MPSVYLYVIARDFGFAPNPFHGYCTLATCKPRIRRTAQSGDWVFGVGGARLHATGRCIFAMQVTDKTTFDAYSTDPKYYQKKPVRNGSKIMLVGDNIYSRSDLQSAWKQADSHHSNPDGSLNMRNLVTDTSTNAVLISRKFVYFGAEAPQIPSGILTRIGYSNVRDYRKFPYATARELVTWLLTEYSKDLNQVIGDPFDFAQSAKRYAGVGNKIV
jgi:hypothetical protein